MPQVLDVGVISFLCMTSEDRHRAVTVVSASQLHINILELRTVCLMLYQLKDNSRTTAYMYMTTVVSHINMKGVARSWSLWQETIALFN